MATVTCQFEAVPEEIDEARWRLREDRPLSKPDTNLFVRQALVFPTLLRCGDAVVFDQPVPALDFALCVASCLAALQKRGDHISMDFDECALRLECRAMQAQSVSVIAKIGRRRLSGGCRLQDLKLAIGEYADGLRSLLRTELSGLEGNTYLGPWLRDGDLPPRFGHCRD
ncbi:MAG TPA: hypothetical protein VFY90_05310 [Tepidiformaceae bacterium]|nr:hypothetical protein [Tepidiformaceae bacterium]